MEDALRTTIDTVKMLIQGKRFNECEAVISAAMLSYPHDAIPHNLMGLTLEKELRHEDAMKHFRAAYALDPTYRPASWNLDCFSSFYKTSIEAYYIDDCIVHDQSQNGKAEQQCI